MNSQQSLQRHPKPAKRGDIPLASRPKKDYCPSQRADLPRFPTRGSQVDSGAATQAPGDRDPEQASPDDVPVNENYHC